ncbi:putative 2,3-diketo-5-methylthiopentyl-1-phosphate enolase, Phosphoric monoester hydrolase [Helianthus annuus]|uniref:2,3-diketo-5-methylthiopentyl-1-phosphate enolase, Phosphoric monoester hydrolase n=1 Tax=Helianthus annuus TaxID=4232 RepID=A0A251TBF0_HELAN|nr:putative 2,3-diketo-5-methylthiopentyl-1-phosphate enolase, Phosphoric monoester hydrolase [Helianthus annuus]KAJ0516463.1 putative 2,3-diketo-5-methylthiopentyl-1-phosphate enolase, Phosphoric monoester hydrolase [Helianthus annuus]KAJ0684465.1 putative 2,3-diketo-5-methylthiopentyl-1-phosphate enolase, Phosphoric monoester hydrolase [Helianthus annuus]KAJ0874075.1 putative 2,3-diketo-5-methylthiopentyl-1-phosphate enolase, Phosphoric monoester hydrolase [Helianthus annuus]
MYDDNNDQSYGDEQRFKGLYVELVVPIIENIVLEIELTKSLVSPTECYHCLFDAAIIVHQLGLEWPTPSHSPIQRSNPLLGGQATNISQKVGDLNRRFQGCIVLYIEGTTTLMSFVTYVLFPYAQNNDIDFTQDINCCDLYVQVEDDLQHGIVDVVLIPFDGAGKHAMMIVALVANVEGMIKSDKKITSLKQLQVSKFNMLFSFFNQKIYFKLLNILIYGRSHMAHWI